MKTLEEVIKNKASFVVVSEEGKRSKQVFKPEDYSIDFLKEKTKTILYFSYCHFFSSINLSYYKVKIYLHENGENGGGGRLEKIIEMDSIRPDFVNSCYLWCIDQQFDYIKRDFCHQILTEPFRIYIEVLLQN